MHVICDRAALLDAINLVSGVVASRTPRPQLTAIKFVARRDGDIGELVLAGTDGDIALALTLAQIDVKKEGEALVPADKLRQIVGAEDHEPTLSIETDGDTCVIKGADATFKVFGFPPADFPPPPDFNAAVKGGAASVITQESSTFKELIARTLFATARENSRYAINGVLFKRDGKKLEMVATDGRRLALARAQLKEAGEASSCIIPTKALTLLNKLLDTPDESIEAAFTDHQAIFSIGGGAGGVGRATLATNLVEGVFPPYEDVIPKDQDKKVTFDRDVLYSGVRRAALLTNEESRGVRLQFTGADKQLELTSRAPEMGEANVRLDVAGYQGDDIEIGFNPGFIIDALKVIQDPEVTMELKAANRPGLIKSGPDFTYVVMPVNLQ